MLFKFFHLSHPSQAAMDPLSAISLASAIISFVDYGSKLLSGAHEIYRSSHGLTLNFEQIEDACERSSELTKAIQSRFDTSDHEGLKTLAVSCLDTAEKINLVLNGMRLRYSEEEDPIKLKKFKSIRKAWVQLRSKKEVEELDKKLQDYNRDLSHYLIFMTRYLAL